jgi:Xaa-Pro aminopeptidase
MTLDERESRLDQFLDVESAGAVWLARPDSFAWATGGDNLVDRTAPVGAAAVGYFGDGDWTVVTNNVEAERIAAEQLPSELSMSVAADDWYEADLAASVAARSPDDALADFDVPGVETFDPTRLRLRLSEDDIDAYRQLGEEVARVVEHVCRELQPGDTEREVAAGLRVGLAGRGIDTPVVLVGGAERAESYRHPTPTDRQLGDYAVVIVTARRDGLHASLTRTVAFDAPDWLTERHHAAQQVETSALAATHRVAEFPDDATAEIDDFGTADEVFDAITEAYADAGYPDEWREHHQGGATGYAGREWFAMPDSDAPVVAPAAYAWNPTVQGAKSEGTAVVTEDGVEMLTETGDWPTTAISADGITLERPDVLAV